MAGGYAITADSWLRLELPKVSIQQCRAYYQNCGFTALLKATGFLTAIMCRRLVKP